MHALLIVFGMHERWRVPDDYDNDTVLAAVADGIIVPGEGRVTGILRPGGMTAPKTGDKAPNKKAKAGAEDGHHYDDCDLAEEWRCIYDRILPAPLRVWL